MKTLTILNAKKWCDRRNLSITNNNIINFDILDNFKIPNDAGKRIALIKQIFENYKKERTLFIWITIGNLAII